MKEEIQYLVLQKEYADYRDKIMDFYKPEYGDSFNEETMNNSAFIGLALTGETVVGAGRVISDLSRHAELVDLIVDPAWRKQGIGSELARRLVDKLKENKVRYIGLVKDPNYPWLKDFYTKLGFKPLPADSYFEM
ncbi:TPA: hypothetical protein DIV45_02720 [Patescibacteria group bacterium]|nr:hypothetical protein [Patescibacteria group bacterium]